MTRSYTPDTRAAVARASDHLDSVNARIDRHPLSFELENRAVEQFCEASDLCWQESRDVSQQFTEGARKAREAFDEARGQLDQMELDNRTHIQSLMSERKSITAEQMRSELTASTQLSEWIGQNLSRASQDFDMTLQALERGRSIEFSDLESRLELAQRVCDGVLERCSALKDERMKRFEEEFALAERHVEVARKLCSDEHERLLQLIEAQGKYWAQSLEHELEMQKEENRSKEATLKANNEWWSQMADKVSTFVTSVLPIFEPIVLIPQLVSMVVGSPTDPAKAKEGEA